MPQHVREIIMKKYFQKGFLKADSGNAAIESVFIIPFLCILYFGMEDLTSLILYNKKLTDVSLAVSDSVAQYKNSITRAQVTDIENTIALIMPSGLVNSVQVDVYDYYLNGAAVTKRWSTKSPSGAACTAPNTSNYANMMGPGNDVIVAVTCMTYTPWVLSFGSSQSMLGANSFVLSQGLAAVPYQSKVVSCVTTAGGNTLCNE